MARMVRTEAGEAVTSGASGPHPVVERRRQRRPGRPHEYLQQMPALVLLNRLPTPTLAVGLDGEVIYANPAFASMLGHDDTDTVMGQSLSQMMSGHSFCPAEDCVTALRGAGGGFADWCHADGYNVKTVVSQALLTRRTDPLLLVTVIDVTDALWTASA